MMNYPKDNDKQIDRKAASDPVKRFAENLSKALLKRHIVRVENSPDHSKQTFEIIKVKMSVLIAEESPYGSKFDTD